MLRRAVLNMLLGNATESTVTGETAALIDTPFYLKSDLTLPVVQEFQNLVPGQVVPVEVSTAYAFSICWSTPADLVVMLGLAAGSGLQAGAAPEESGIMLGFHADGYLYIGDIVDKRKLSFDKLQQGFQLRLEVNPQPGGLTHAKLTLRDSAGLTLALVKNKQYRPEAWKGNILISGIPLKHLKIEGRSLNEA